MNRTEHSAKAATVHSRALATRHASPRSDGTGAPSSRLLGLLAFAIAALFVSIAPASASAAEPHPFLEVFGSAAHPTVAGAAGMAVDPATGDLLVIGYVPGSGGTISRFKPDGTPANFSALTSTNVIDGHAGEADATPQGEILSNEGFSSAEVQIAVAPPGAGGGTAGNIYATDAENGVVDVFSSSGEYLTQLGGSFPCGVAVAPNGNVFVGDFVAEKVDKYVPTVNGSPPPPSSYAKTAELNALEPCQVAAIEGFVIVARLESEARKIDSEGAEEGTFKYSFGGGITALSVDPANGHIYAGSGVAAREYDVSGATEATLVEPSIEPGSSVLGVAINGTSGDVYLARSSSSAIEVYGPRPAFTQPLLVVVQGEGQVTATGIACTEAGNGTAACEEEFPEGTEVPLSAAAAIGSHFVGWTTIEGAPGTCTATTASCKTGALTAPAKLKATFAPNPPQPLLIEVQGEGQVTATGIACSAAGNGTTACEEEFPEGTEVPLSAAAAIGSHFVGWTTIEGAPGTCTGATASCKTGALTAPTKLKATFEENAAAPLTVVIAGHGTVTSNPAGLNCTGPAQESCTEEFEGTVTLTASPDPALSPQQV